MNSTNVLHTNTDDVLKNYDPTNVILRLQVEVEGTLPHSQKTQTFQHENWYHASRLNEAQLVNPDLALTYNNSTQKFNVEAKNGVAAWVWLDYPNGAVLNFDSNAFWLLPGESRQVGYNVKSDTTNGAWIDGVTVQSMYDLYLP